MGGLREIRAFGAEDRMLARVTARENALLSLQRRLARDAAVAGAVSFLVPAGRGAGPARRPGRPLVRDASRPVDGALLLFALLAAFELAGGLTRAGVLAGHMRHAAARVVEAGDQAVAPAVAAVDPAAGAVREPTGQDVPQGHALRLRDVGFPLAA